jgi:site-specific DNA-methyltransferase (adenine-specific)
MPHPGKPARLPEPHTILHTRRGTLRFYLGDCLDVLAGLPEAAISVVVTSPPYNLGVRYRSYDDSVPRVDYLEWTRGWIQAIRRLLAPDGSLFLNVGAKPTDPWIAMDVAQAARPHLQLQNTIHWIKSIAIDRDAAGKAVNLDYHQALRQYKPINSPPFVNQCPE